MRSGRIGGHHIELRGKILADTAPHGRIGAFPAGSLGAGHHDALSVVLAGLQLDGEASVDVVRHVPGWLRQEVMTRRVWHERCRGHPDHRPAGAGMGERGHLAQVGQVSVRISDVGLQPQRRLVPVGRVERLGEREQRPPQGAVGGGPPRHVRGQRVHQAVAGGDPRPLQRRRDPDDAVQNAAHLLQIRAPGRQQRQRGQPLVAALFGDCREGLPDALQSGMREPVRTTDQIRDRRQQFPQLGQPLDLIGQLQRPLPLVELADHPHLLHSGPLTLLQLEDPGGEQPIPAARHHHAAPLPVGMDDTADEVGHVGLGQPHQVVDQRPQILLETHRQPVAVPPELAVEIAYRGVLRTVLGQQYLTGRLLEGLRLQCIGLVDDDQMAAVQQELLGGHAPPRGGTARHRRVDVAGEEVRMIGDEDVRRSRGPVVAELPAATAPRTGYSLVRLVRLGPVGLELVARLLARRPGIHRLGGGGGVPGQRAAVGHLPVHPGPEVRIVLRIACRLLGQLHHGGGGDDRRDLRGDPQGGQVLPQPVHRGQNLRTLRNDQRDHPALPGAPHRHEFTQDVLAHAGGGVEDPQRPGLNAQELAHVRAVAAAGVLSDVRDRLAPVVLPTQRIESARDLVQVGEGNHHLVRDRGLTQLLHHAGSRGTLVVEVVEDVHHPARRTERIPNPQIADVGARRRGLGLRLPLGRVVLELVQQGIDEGLLVARRQDQHLLLPVARGELDRLTVLQDRRRLGDKHRMGSQDRRPLPQHPRDPHLIGQSQSGPAVPQMHLPSDQEVRISKIHHTPPRGLLLGRPVGENPRGQQNRRPQCQRHADGVPCVLRRRHAPTPFSRFVTAALKRLTVNTL